VTQPAEEAVAPIESVREFREAFQGLVGDLQGVRAVVVFIDDLDRCLPETVVDTFEAIRLFLNTPQTAYVVAANQQVVESAINSRYPELRRQDGTGVGADYLEKMLQMKVAIPALSAPEVESYTNLLLADLHLDEPAMARVGAAAREVRVQDNLTVAFNLGMASDVLGDVPEQLARDLVWAAQVAPALASGLRGNPRQVKRFLNTISLRRRGAERRSVALDPAVLAKLLVLEEQQVDELQTLFDWQVAANGRPAQLAEAELLARGERGPDDVVDGGEVEAAEKAGERRRQTAEPRVDRPQTDGPESDGRVWAAKPRVREWLQLDPPLRDIDLRPYFTYSRDRLSPGVAASRLPADLQGLVVGAQSDTPHVRRAVVDRICALDPDRRAQVVEALASAIERNPGGPAVDAAAEIAEKAGDAVDAVVRALRRIPPTVFPPAKAVTIVRRLPSDHPAVVALLDGWAGSGVSNLANLVAKGRQVRERRP
jgi:hypothetical protein